MKNAWEIPHMFDEPSKAIGVMTFREQKLESAKYFFQHSVCNGSSAF